MLGGGVIQVGLPQLDDRLLADLSALPAVKRASRAVLTVTPEPGDGQAVPETGSKSEIVKLECENSQKALVSLVTYISQHDLRITSLETLEPNLESVFLHLTGKKLRE